MPSELKAPKVAAPPDPDLLNHIHALGLSDVEAYRDWCARHGFSRRLDKHWRLRLKERSLAGRAVADARLAQKRQELRKPQAIVERICNGLSEDAVTQPEWKAVCRAFHSSRQSPRIRDALRELLQCLCDRGDFLTDAATSGGGHLNALLAIARQSPRWIRPVADWKSSSHNIRRQFASLLRHLFARWPVPAFMDSAWFLGNTSDARRKQFWYARLGLGDSIRIVDLPIPYTKRMAHHFMQAPADWSIDAALRWGQVRGLGGPAELARAIAGTRLVQHFVHDDFWTTVIQFFIRFPDLDLVHVGPIVDYLQNQRFHAFRGHIAQPNLTMKGRTPASLLRQVEEWHAALDLHDDLPPDAQWNPSGISAFEFLEGAESWHDLGYRGKVWRFTELLTARSLSAEGRAMKHCVGSYARQCVSGACSIWTLEMETHAGRTKVMTVEVALPSKEICQARGKCNNAPTEKQLAILRRWAENAGLTLSIYL